MVQLTTEQRVFVVESHIRLKSYAAVQRELKDRFPEREPLANRTIQENVSKYHTFGTNLNLNKGNSERSRTARTPENIMRVRNVLQDVNEMVDMSNINSFLIIVIRYARVPCT